MGLALDLGRRSSNQGGSACPNLAAGLEIELADLTLVVRIEQVVAAGEWSDLVERVAAELNVHAALRPEDVAAEVAVLGRGK